MRAMSYRDEQDALRGRVAQLEGELADARATIARLSGGTAHTEPGTKIERSRLIDGPSRYEREERLPYEISEVGYERIAEVLRTRLGLTNVSQVGRSLVSPGVFSLSREGDHTRVRMTMSWQGLKGGPIAMGGLAALFGGLPTLAVLLEVATHGGPSYLPFLALGIVPALARGGAVLGRRLSAKRSRDGLAQAQGAFETILAIAEEHRVTPRARVELEADDEVDEVELAPMADRELAR